MIASVIYIALVNISSPLVQNNHYLSPLHIILLIIRFHIFTTFTVLSLLGLLYFELQHRSCWDFSQLFTKFRQTDVKAYE